MTDVLFPLPVELSESDRMELETLARSRTVSAAVAQRARMILAMADGVSYGVLSSASRPRQPR